MQRKIRIAFLPLFVLTVVVSRLTYAADEVQIEQEQSKEVLKEFTRSNLVGRLRLYEPVPIEGPYPYLLYTARAGDLVELQLSYPIRPPFPSKIRVRYDPLYFDVVDIVETDNEVVVLNPGQSQTGVIGMGYYSVYLKARKDGQTPVQIPVEFDNGDTETVPFRFKIGPESKTARRVQSTKAAQ